MKLMTIAIIYAIAVAVRGQWDELTTLMTDAVSNEIFPGAVALVFTEHDILYQQAVGAYTYGVPPPATPDRVPEMTMDVCLPSTHFKTSFPLFITLLHVS